MRWKSTIRQQLWIDGEELIRFVYFSLFPSPGGEFSTIVYVCVLVQYIYKYIHILSIVFILRITMNTCNSSRRATVML